MDKAKFRSKVLLEMTRREWNYTDLAEALKLSKQAVSQHLNDDGETVTLSTAYAYARVFGIAPETFVLDESPRTV